MKVLIIVIVVVSGLNIVASEELAADSNVKFIATKSKNDDDDVDEKYFCSAKCDAFPKNTFCGYNKLKVMKTFINQCEMYVENCHTKLDYLWLHDGKCGCKEGENYIYDSIRLPKVNGI